MTITKTTRIDAIDILRGLSLAFMILVNNPGSWGHIYAPLQHANWHGMTATDLVFPFFLFVVGASMACSLQPAVGRGKKPIYAVIKRGVIIALLGFALHVYATGQSSEHWRFMGVLQRIGLCFIIVSLMVIFVPKQWLIPTGIVALIGYTLILLLYSSTPYSLDDNVVGKVDLAVIGAEHMWKGKGIPFDPEGLLSTVPASVTVLLGYLTGLLLQRDNRPSMQACNILMVGTALAVAGIGLSFFQPINKYLWTPTFVLVTAGIAAILLALFIWLWDIKRLRAGLNTFRVYGINPILIYVLAWLVTVTLEKITLFVEGKHLSVKTYLFNQMAQVVPDKLASMLYGLIFVVLFYFLSELLYRKNIIVKV